MTGFRFFIHYVMQKIIKAAVCALYVCVIIIMAVATIIEKDKGTDYVASNIYTSWWFIAVWGLLALVAIAYFLRRRVRRVSTILLHASFILILAGALLTHLTSFQGAIRLRVNQPTDTYYINDKKVGVREATLPFKVRLDQFDISYHDGTEAASDYASKFTIIDGDQQIPATVSMNNIFTYHSMRFYQMSYNPDRHGSVLSINYDPYGIPVTYAGYGMLFLALLWMLLDPKGGYRKVLRSSLLKRGLLTLLVCVGFASTLQAAPVLPKETARKFGELHVLYNDRICPLQTFAIDFTRKLYGKSGYEGYTPEQVLTGFIFWGDEWSKEPILRLKSGELKEALQLPDYCSVNTFFNNTLGGYVIGPYVQEFYQGQNDAFHKQVADVDSKLEMVMQLRRGSLLKVFPFTSKGRTTWYAPTDNVSDSLVDADHRTYMRNVFSLIYQEVLAGNYAHVDQIVEKMGKYQVVNGGTSLPSRRSVAAERIYNAIPFATILSMLNLALGFLTLIVAIWSLTHPAEGKRPCRWLGVGSLVVFALSFLALTFCIALRWVIKGTVPMSNGYETMLFMAWIIMLMALALYHRFHIIMSFGFLMSGFFLLVSHISQMDPEITHMMPVLASPLLSAHVSLIMMAFALLSLTFICGLTAVVLRLVRRRDAKRFEEQAASLQVLSQLFLYPAMTTLGFGIFIGAIWANVSWGTYWSWDPKETWALITMMIYAVALHGGSLPVFRKPFAYHVFMVLAFLSILMTYFGVNYFLGGMHSYA